MWPNRMMAPLARPEGLLCAPVLTDAHSRAPRRRSYFEAGGLRGHIRGWEAPLARPEGLLCASMWTTALKGSMGV